MRINKNKKIKKIHRKNKGGVPIHITYMSFASYHRLSNWVPNQSLDKVILSNFTKCKLSNLNSHEYFMKT